MNPKTVITVVAVALATAVGNAIADSSQGAQTRRNDESCGASDNRGRYDAASGAYRQRRLEIIGLTADQRLVCFSEQAPLSADTIAKVSGLGGSAGDTRLVGLDFRPATGDLYGVGEKGGVYTIDPATAVATSVAQLSVPLSGTSFGVDVNPAADALRIISDTGQNLRFSFALGTTTADVGLTYPPAVTPAAGVSGAAYTNNDLDPNTVTTLYDIDAALDQVAVQAPANSGTLSPTGKLLVDAGSDAGFDIYSTLRKGTTVRADAFASLVVNGKTRLYRIQLLTGRAEFKGNFKVRDRVIGIAIPLNQL